MNTKLSWLASAGVAVVVGVIACGGGGADSSCGNYVDALNSLASKCGAQPVIDPSERSAFVADCAAIAKAPGASNLSSQIDACVNQLNASTCATTGIDCSIRGTLADGSPCASAAQCAGGMCTVTQPSTTSDISCGTCGSYVALGGACGASGGTCDSSQGTCVANKCTAYVAQGGSCANGETCANGSTCDSTSKTCKPPPTKGDACTGIGTCMAPYKCISQVCADAVGQGGACPTGTECQSSLTCDTTTKTCQPTTLAQAGQPCGLVQNQFVQCATNLKCSNSVCVALKASGDTCVAGQGDCQAGLSCVNGTCGVPDYTICNK